MGNIYGRSAKEADLRRKQMRTERKLWRRGWFLLHFCAANWMGWGFTPSVVASPADLPAVADARDAAPSESVAAQIKEAYLLMVNTNYTRAIPLLEGIVQNHPDVMSGWERLGWCYWHVGREKDALALWRHLAAIDPLQPVAYNLLAKGAAIHNDLPTVVKCFEKSLALDPNQTEIRINYARALHWVGRREESRSLLETLRKEFPNRTDIVLAEARALSEDEQYAEALPLWSKLKAQEPHNIEYQANETRCLIVTGQLKPVLSEVRKLLTADLNDRLALEVMADVAEYSDHPEDARPPLRKLLEIQTDPVLREQIRTRLYRLIIRLNHEAPRRYSLAEAIQLLRARLKSDPGAVESMLLLGELLLTDQRPAEAKDLFLDVLQRIAPQNVRAHMGLFEVSIAQQDYREARKQLDFVRQFNPLDPYLDYYLARLETARGDFYHAYQALDRLEATGQRGAVAVLLYHALSPNPCSHSAVPVRQFDEQIKALRDAHINFITPARMAALFQAGNLALPGTQSNLYVLVTFDDVRRDAMIYGTPIARKYGVTFLQHIPLAPILEGNPFHCSWNEMVAYQKTGCWIFGSHCMYAHDMPEINREHRLGSALANYKFDPATGIFETPEQFAVRLQAEFTESRKLIMEHLGENHQPPFIAYPFGDIGQEGYCYVSNAVPAVLAACGKVYKMGWIQTSFGYAVNGDNPLLYQRFDVDRTLTGTQLVQQIYEHHPVYLARRLRAEIAALDDKLYRARDAISLLEQTGFPAGPLETSRTYVEDRLARKSIAPVGTEVVLKGPFGIELQHPYFGVNAEGDRDNQTHKSWLILGLAGIKLTPNLAAEGDGGIGRMSQTVTVTNLNVKNNVSVQTNVDLKVDERDIGLNGVFNFPNGYYLAGNALRREFSDPANHTYWRFIGESQVRPITPVDLTLRFEHDVAPSALAAVSNITYNALLLTGVGRVTDWWDITADGGQYRFSDDNTRTELGLESTWTIHEPSGLFLGGRYAYTTSPIDFEDAYWTPYHLHRLLAETGLKGSYLEMYYHLLLSAGIGRQDVRPETQVAYDEAVVLSHSQHFDPGPPPEANWQPVYHLAASCNIPIGQRWSVRAEVAYGHVPGYTELRGIAGAYLKF